MIKKLVLFIVAFFVCGVALAHTIRWHVGDTVYTTSTCNSGDSITPPTAPAKTGYSFVDWVGYQPIEYIEGTGTQYIDTGYSAPNGYKAHIKFVIDTINGSGIGIIGSHNASSPYGRNNLMIYNNDLQVCAGGVYKITDLSPVVLNRITELVFSTFLEDISVVDHNITYVGDAQSNRSSNTLWLFSYNGYSVQRLAGKIYFVQIWNTDNTLVRDFIPVLDKNGIPCMFDKVTKQFFYNQGTGNFIAGPAI